jgi:hypothetical protein
MSFYLVVTTEEREDEGRLTVIREADSDALVYEGPPDAARMRQAIRLWHQGVDALSSDVARIARLFDLTAAREKERVDGSE